MISDRIVIGTVARPRGIAGEVKINPLTDDPRRFRSLKTVAIGGREYRVVGASVNPAGVYVALEGVNDRDAAEKLRGKELTVPREEAVIADGRVFIADLIGCEVSFTDGETLGVLEDVLQYGAADVYVVRGAKGRVLFPALARVIKEEDPSAGVIVLNREAFSEVAVYED